MMSFLSTLIFFLALFLFFFVPGFICWRFFFGRAFSTWEEIVFSFLLSVTLLDIVMLVLGRTAIPLLPFAIALPLLLLSLIFGLILWRKRALGRAPADVSLELSPSGRKLFFALIIATLFIRVVALAPAILPTSTDLGHHMYWAKYIALHEAIPTYEKQEIVVQPETGIHEVVEPRPIADFIIGEHLPFAFLSRLTGLGVMSAFPMLFLLLVNLLSILATAALAWRLGQAYKDRLNPETFALLTLFLLGPLFALSSPQLKFVSGGVVGNIFGNLFIPAILLLFYRGLHERRGGFIAAGIGFSFILAYTHHLSTLVLAFLLLGMGFLVFLSRQRDLTVALSEWFSLFRERSVLFLLVLSFLFMAFVALPSYMEREAIDSAIGTPTKTTRTGLSFLQVTNAAGAGKVALGTVGFMLGVFLFRRAPLATIVTLGWGGILLIMAMYPQWLFLDIPSSRIGSYLSYSLGLLSAFSLALFLMWLQREKKEKERLVLSIVFALALLFVIGTGSFDNASSYTARDRGQEVVETIAVSEYAKEHLSHRMILKDHNYLAADAWMKLFFMQDYGYPLSRGLFSRYQEGGNRREQCSLIMISTPNTTAGMRCFEETGVSVVIVNPHFDTAQFTKSDLFSKLYTSEKAALYERRP